MSKRELLLLFMIFFIIIGDSGHCLQTFLRDKEINGQKRVREEKTVYNEVLLSHYYTANKQRSRKNDEQKKKLTNLAIEMCAIANVYGLFFVCVVNHTASTIEHSNH